MALVTHKQAKRRLEKVGPAKCEGCGEWIYPDKQEIEYVKTKRGEELFFHSKCINKIWRE